MLSRPAQRLGHNWAAHWNLAPGLFQNGQALMCMKRAMRYSWPCCPHLKTRHSVQFAGRPWLWNWNWKSPSLLQKCSIHLCGVNMKAEGDEPPLKQARYSEDRDITYSPHEELRTSVSNKGAFSPSRVQHEEKCTPGNVAFGSLSITFSSMLSVSVCATHSGRKSLYGETDFMLSCGWRFAAGCPIFKRVG